MRPQEEVTLTEDTAAASSHDDAPVSAMVAKGLYDEGREEEEGPIRGRMPSRSLLLAPPIMPLTLRAQR